MPPSGRSSSHGDALEITLFAAADIRSAAQARDVSPIELNAQPLQRRAEPRTGLFGLRPALVKNRGTLRQFVLLVERGSEADFDAYCVQENLAVIAWLDDEAALAAIGSAMHGNKAP